MGEASIRRVLLRDQPQGLAERISRFASTPISGATVRVAWPRGEDCKKGSARDGRKFSHSLTPVRRLWATCECQSGDAALSMDRPRLDLAANSDVPRHALRKAAGDISATYATRWPSRRRRGRSAGRCSHRPGRSPKSRLKRVDDIGAQGVSRKRKRSANGGFGEPRMRLK